MIASDKFDFSLKGVKMNYRKYISKKLLLIPFFMIASISIVMAVCPMVIAKAPFGITFLAFTLIASLLNVFPFFILRLVHLKVHLAAISDNNSFYAAFVMGVLLMLVVIGDSLIAFFLRKPGIQFIPLVFLFLPVYTFLLMIIVYFTYLIFKFILLKFKK